MKLAATQLLEELRPAVSALTVLGGDEAAGAAQAGLEAHAEAVVVLLEGSAGPGATAAADAVLHLVYGGAQPDPQWWDSRLGRLVAAHASDALIPHSMAADILGVARGTVSTLVNRGALEAVEVEGAPRQLSRASVLRRKLALADDPRAAMWAARSKE